MNILITVYRYQGYGGAEVSIELMAKELIKRGHKVIIASTTEYPGIKTYIMKEYKKIPSFWYHKTYLVNFLNKIIKEENIDIIYVQDLWTSYGGMIAGFKNKIKVAVHLRDYWFACLKSSCIDYREKDCDYCSFPKAIKCFKFYRLPWEFNKYLMLRKCWKLLKKVHVIYTGDKYTNDKLNLLDIQDNIVTVNNFRDTSLFKDVKGVKEFKKINCLNGVVIGFIGRLVNIKGSRILMKIIPEILKRFKNITFVIVGGGKYRKEFINFIKNNDLNKKVVYLGSVDFDRIPLFYKSLDILLMPTIWNEPYGGVQLEASASALPIVGSNVGGIRDGKFGIYVKPEDINKWVDVVSKLIKDKGYRKKEGARNKKIVERDFNMIKYVDKIEAGLK